MRGGWGRWVEQVVPHHGVCPGLASIRDGRVAVCDHKAQLHGCTIKVIMHEPTECGEVWGRRARQCDVHAQHHTALLVDHARRSQRADCVVICFAHPRAPKQSGALGMATRTARRGSNAGPN